MATLSPFDLELGPASGADGVLERNLAAMALRSPRAAERVRRASARAGVVFAGTEEAGALTASVEGRALASRRRPLGEASALAGSVDLTTAGAVVVLGFGVGHHASALAARAKRHTAVIVFEPDVGLLRAVLERVDCSGWVRESNSAFFTEAEDEGALAEGLQGLEPLLAAGIRIVEHAPSKARLGAAGGRFAEVFARYVGSVRTQVITTMVQMDVTIRNLLMNVDHYVSRPGIDDLAGFAAGKPAIVVSAGPSLQRNIAILEDPAFRERCVIIAVQTVLKPLLARGIRPHFVTALDYHEVSARFYEGLRAEDVRGVTLIAEPKANPAILGAFPGDVRLVSSDLLDTVAGEGLARPRASLPPGATVAHLAYSVARFLGADPVVLVGQDLAFTDGQYYSKGAAIHDVWSPELNEFNTLEMMEWQRIVRWRGHLHRMTDHLGRAVYTDDQMRAYLAQFQREFLVDREKGLTTIDATEGGVRKDHTLVMPLREALERHAPPAAARLPEIPPASADRSPERMKRLARRLEELKRDAGTIARLSRETAGHLSDMLPAQQDTKRVNRLIDKVNELRDRVQAVKPAYGLVQRLNQAGAFKRFKADRLLMLQEALGPLEVQRKQIERDVMNVTWISDAAEALAERLGAAGTMLTGGPRQVRDIVPREDKEGGGSAGGAAPTARVAAVVLWDPLVTDLGLPRRGDGLLRGRPVAAHTLERLARCRALERIALVAAPGASERASELVRGIDRATVMEWPRDLHAAWRTSRASVRAARLWARSSWRSGLGGMSAWDEPLDPATAAWALAAAGLDSALIVGADWGLVDTELCEQVIARHAENPGAHPITFCQAPPGLAGCVVGRATLDELSRGRGLNDPLATIGGVLGYSPRRPRPDPITAPCCVQVDPLVRSLHERLVLDDDGAIARAALLIEARGAAELARAAGASAHPALGHLTIDLRGGGVDPVVLAPRCAERWLRQVAEAAPGVALTIRGGFDRDPLSCDLLPTFIATAGASGIAGIHVRTHLHGGAGAARAVIEAGADVLSVDLLAGNADTYRALSGHQGFDTIVEAIDELLKERRVAGGMAHPWIVPRITRRDEVYEQVEDFFDRGLFFAGACVIDPLPAPADGQRIEPLGTPRGAMQRERMTAMTVHHDGAVIEDGRMVGSVVTDGVGAVWSRLIEQRNARVGA